MNHFNLIRDIICIGEGFTPDELVEKTDKDKLERKEEKVFSRQLIMFFQKQTSKDTWRMIGDYFGLDHATAMHACKVIQNYIDTDKKIAAKIIMYQEKINNYINFENNLITDKILEIRDNLKRRIENNEPITFEIVAIYNYLLDKKEENKPVNIMQNDSK